MNLRIVFSTLILLFTANLAYSTHNRAGQISVRQLDCGNSLAVEATIVTFTKDSAYPVDRDTLTICWGDGVCESVVRQNGPGNPPRGELLENDTKINIYVSTHQYDAPGTYAISMNDPNRNAGILNVNAPYSEQIPFHLQTVYTLPNVNFQGCNDTPILLQPPIDVGCVGQVFTHNPNAIDPDGDSLSYHFIVPLQDVNMDVPLYQYPNEVLPAPGEDILTINETTGDIVWNAPQLAGEYNLAMAIVSYRQGIPIDTVIRDMQILIKECDNIPPEVFTPYEEICVEAGQLIEFQVTATAPLVEQSQRVRLSALGGPFEQGDESAEFLPDENEFNQQPLTKTFKWQTTCNHINEQYYTVVFKATDDYFGDIGLATLKTVRIKVVGPPPEDVTALSDNTGVEISWASPYSCQFADDDYFRGFSVWRRIGSNDFLADDCETGLDGRGYERLNGPLINDEVNGRYYYFDNELDPGRTYCYRVLAHFAKSTPNGVLTYNAVLSKPSNEDCVQLKRDVPLLLNVDVLDTDNANGAINVCWTKPLPIDLDTIVNPGSYRYEVWRADGIESDFGMFSFTGTAFESAYFDEPIDTCFVDMGLNTVDQAYSYIIVFSANGNNVGDSAPSSSVYLNSAPTDMANILTWEEGVSWSNYQYVILRENTMGVFDSIGITTELTYLDEGLVNGEEYCYKIRSYGAYGIEGLNEPLINHSQIACQKPYDNVPPCAPLSLEVENVCNLGYACNEITVFENTLSWSNPNDDCETTGDVEGYRIYYASEEGGAFMLVGNIESASLTSFTHEPGNGELAGCYYVTALDENQNESLPSTVVCVDNCPFYELPNAFSPNSDGQNDMYQPFPYCFIESIELKVYNQWGNLVFETRDPDINWDGKTQDGKDLSPGTYYYTCQVFEQSVSGVKPAEELLKGYIELFR